VTTICEGCAKKSLGRDIAPEKVTVIPNAVDVDRFNEGKPNPDLVQRYGLGSSTVLGSWLFLRVRRT
jgi:hypothetical protein